MAEKGKTNRRRERRRSRAVRGVTVELRAPEDRPLDPILVPHLERLMDALEATEEEDPYGAILETICGVTDDSQPIEQYDGTLGVTQTFAANHERAVCQVQWNNNLGSIYTNPGDVSGVRWGTGTMISPDLMLTAGHLFDQTGNGWTRPRVNGTSNIISPQEIATNMHVNFNYQVDPAGSLRVEDSYAITQLIEYRLGGVDFAVCRIAGNPGNTYGWTAVSTADAAVNDMLCIIGHPAGQPKRIEAGPCTALSGNQIQYNDIDTLGGNSGSGILHEPSGQLVGVHTNGGCNAAGTGSNVGMRISAIRAQSPTVTGLGTRTNVIADAIGTSVQDDLGPVITFRDNDKRIWDDVATVVWRDIQPTLAVADKHVWDDLTTHVGTDVLGPGKRIDDVKAGGYDKQWDNPGFLDPMIADPGVAAGGGGRPFVLSTPHHSPVLPGMPGPVSSLAQVEAALAQTQQMLSDLASQVAALQGEATAGRRSSG